MITASDSLKTLQKLNKLLTTKKFHPYSRAPRILPMQYSLMGKTGIESFRIGSISSNKSHLLQEKFLVVH